MSTYDARAARFWASFAKKPSVRSYDAIMPTVVPFGAPGAPVNTAAPPLAEASEAMNFTKPDATPHGLLSEAVWKSGRGAQWRVPAPRHTLLMPPDAAWDEPERGGRRGRRLSEGRPAGVALAGRSPQTVGRCAW